MARTAEARAQASLLAAVGALFSGGLWFYVDQGGAVQGPWAAKDMLTWYKVRAPRQHFDAPRRISISAFPAALAPPGGSHLCPSSNPPQRMKCVRFVW